MKQKTGRKLLGVLLTLAMVVGLLPGTSLTALAFPPDSGASGIFLDGGTEVAKAYAAYDVTTDVNKVKSDDELRNLKVTFNNMYWYIIEDNSTSATEGTVTLFMAGRVGASKFDDSSNDYSSSTVKGDLDGLLTSEGENSFKSVEDAIVAVNLTDVNVTGAKLWLLSKEEVEKLSANFRKLDTAWWWLRSPGATGKAACVKSSNGDVTEDTLEWTFNVRPALQLDLSKVTFDSTTKTFSLKQELTEYPLWVGGTQVTDANATDTTVHPTWSYAADTHTLTLKGFVNNGTARMDIQSGANNAAIYYDDFASGSNPLKIELAEGTTNSLTMTGERVYGIYVSGSELTITGKGTLNVQSEDFAINDAWGVAISGGTVTATATGSDRAGITAGNVAISNAVVTAIGTGDNSSGINASKTVTIESGEVTASGTGWCIQGRTGITINGGTVTASGTAEVTAEKGIYSEQGSVTVTDGTVEAKGTAYGIFAMNGVTISDGTVTAIATGSDWAFGIKTQANGSSVTIEGGTVSASGANQAIGGTVKNAVAGTGWDNTEGNGDGMAITINTTEGQMLEYKKVEFKAATGAYTVTFNANGGTGTMAPQMIFEMTELNPNAFTRSGYIFIGWNTAADGTGTSYRDGFSSLAMSLQQTQHYMLSGLSRMSELARPLKPGIR